jgi:hypothetical protein
VVVFHGQCILDTDELCSRSATGLLKLQQTIWRINRSISRCSSVAEALGVVDEMKAAGFNAANEGALSLPQIVMCHLFPLISLMVSEALSKSFTVRVVVALVYLLWSYFYGNGLINANHNHNPPYVQGES